MVDIDECKYYSQFLGMNIGYYIDDNYCRSKVDMMEFDPRSGRVLFHLQNRQTVFADKCELPSLLPPQ